MEENKDFKAEEITKENQSAVEENELVTEDTEATSKEEAEEIVEEYTENDDLALIGKMKDENKKLSNEVDALKERLLRLTAEYDNYRKRTAKEKEGIYTDACTDVLKEILPVADNLERAIAVDGTVEDLKKGVEMTIKGFINSLEKLGVEEIDTNNGFDPNFHQALMMEAVEGVEPNHVTEVLQKGYMLKDRILRAAMVKVSE